MYQQNKECHKNVCVRNWFYITSHHNKNLTVSMWHYDNLFGEKTTHSSLQAALKILIRNNLTSFILYAYPNNENENHEIRIMTYKYHKWFLIQTSASVKYFHVLTQKMSFLALLSHYNTSKDFLPFLTSFCNH